MPLSIIRTPNSGFYHNVKINRPMYNMNPKFEPWKLQKKMNKLNYCACNHAIQKYGINSNDILYCNIVLTYLLILLIFTYLYYLPILHCIFFLNKT